MYNWLNLGIANFCEMQKNNRVPHALLLCVDMGLGAQELAYEISRRFLCLERGEETCQCRSCMQMSLKAHPDISIIQKNAKSQGIGIEQIRNGLKVLDETAANNHGKVCIIHETEFLTEPAANSLLKTLEEPPRNSLIILTTGNLQALLPTIVSRAMRITIPLPNVSVLNDFLKQELKTQDDFYIELAIFGREPLNIIKKYNDGTCQKVRLAIKNIVDCILGFNSAIDTVNYLEKEIKNQDIYVAIFIALFKEAIAFQYSNDSNVLMLLRDYPQCLEVLTKIDASSLHDGLLKLYEFKKVRGIKNSLIASIQLIAWLNLLSK